MIKTISCGTATLRTKDDVIEVLLVKPREPDVWGFPKGRLNDENESFIAAAARETFEETGVEVIVYEDKLLGTAHVRNGRENKTVFVYMAEPIDLDARAFAADGENHEVAWWPIDRLPEPHPYQRKLFDNLVKTVEDYLSSR